MTPNDVIRICCFSCFCISGLCFTQALVLFFAAADSFSLELGKVTKRSSSLCVFKSHNPQRKKVFSECSKRKVLGVLWLFHLASHTYPGTSQVAWSTLMTRLGSWVQARLEGLVSNSPHTEWEGTIDSSKGWIHRRPKT